MSSSLQALAVVFSGLLAGEELIIRYGVQPALRSLDEHAHVQARVALVRRLRIVVPLLMLPTTAAVLAAAIFGADSPWRWASLAALTAFLAFSFLGTVPINMKVIEWNPSSPPPGWQATVRRWERLDVLRSTAAILAFVCVTAAGYFG